MPPSRLSNVDKQEILNLYQRGQETTTTLASRYGVSNSTVIRVLKSFLPSDAYEALVQSKRSNGREKLSDKTSLSPQSSLSLEIELDSLLNSLDEPVSDVKPIPAKVKKSGRKSRIPAKLPEVTAAAIAVTDDQLPLLAITTPFPESRESLSDDSLGTPAPRPKPKRVIASPDLELASASPATQLANSLDEEISAVETELRSELLHPVVDQDDEDEDEDDLEDDFDEDDEGDETDDAGSSDLSVLATKDLEVLPLEEGSLPRTCYVVIDRTAELVTRPLKDFEELGKIPNQEERDRILPVFDNHRIARRFSNRNQRIIKVPDGRMLSKASPQLQAKGITRLLIDGRVYTLPESDPEV